MINKSKYFITTLFVIFAAFAVLAGGHADFSAGYRGSINADWTAWGEFESVSLDVWSDFTTTCYNPNGTVSRGRVQFRIDYQLPNVEPYAGSKKGKKLYHVEIGTDDITPMPREAGCPTDQGSVTVAGPVYFEVVFTGAQGYIDEWTWQCDYSWNSSTGAETVTNCVPVE